jgi:16S rRNA (uracil1498-N3)-methyltransferase
MSNKNAKIRLFVENTLKPGAIILCEQNQGHYLVNVMRIKMGDMVSIFNGREGEWIAEVIKIGKGKASITIREKIAEQINEPDLWYLFAPVKKARIDYMIEKATELGVSLIWPVITKRTNLDRLKMDKLCTNAVEAAEQCGRMTVPEIKNIILLEDLLAKWPEDRKILFCDEAGDAKSFKEIAKDYSQNNQKWAVLIGPEGGFTEEERHKIRGHKNTIPLTLGSRILRADTAAVAVLSLWQNFLGDG